MPIADSTFEKLAQIVGRAHCTRQKEELACHAYDATAQVYLPDAVVFPADASQISRIMKLARAEKFYVIPRGAGSGMTGGCLPVRGGVVVSLSRMNQIISIDTDNLVAVAQPGVVTGKFHAAVEKLNLFYPPDPASSAFSTLGGNLAECAGGPRAVKYGVTRDYVLGLEAVLPTSEIIQTGVRTAKGVVGYDVTRLLVGSEGTLCIITQMTLRLLPLPETVATFAVYFDKMEIAAETVSEIVRRGIIPRTIEFMDQASIRCVESHLKIGLSTHADALLLMEVDGSGPQVRESMEKLKNICKEMGAGDTSTADTPRQAADFWKARKSISAALFQYAPHKINEDIVVPRSRIPEMIRKIKTLKNETGLTIACFGHAGDGNIHFNIMLDKRIPEQLKKAEAAIEVLFDYTLALGGTISGEHGVGTTKARFLSKEVGPEEIRLMKRIKNMFDPEGLLNPGKIFPD